METWKSVNFHLFQVYGGETWKRWKTWKSVNFQVSEGSDSKRGRAEARVDKYLPIGRYLSPSRGGFQVYERKHRRALFA